MTRPAHPSSSEAPAELLAQAGFTVMAVLTRLAAEHDMSLTQLRMLGILRDRAPRVVALADFLGLEKSTVSGLVTRSERRGLVARVPSPDDARAVDIVMTPAGLALAVQVVDRLRADLRSLTGRLSPAEQEALAVLLTKALGPDGGDGGDGREGARR